MLLERRGRDRTVLRLQRAGRAPRANGQAERMHRTVKDATVQAYHYATHADLETHGRAFIAAYNFAKHLKSLRWRTPFQAVCDAWAVDPRPFRIDPHHLIPGPYN